MVRARLRSRLKFRSMFKLMFRFMLGLRLILRFSLTLVEVGGGHIVSANFWKAHCAKILIYNILFFGVTFIFYMWTT